MKQTTLNTWLFKLPFKFAIISFALILLLSFLYPFVGQLFFDETHALPMKPLFIFMIISILTGIYFSVKKAPRIKMDTSSFITIHTAQTLLIFLLFSASTYLLLSNQQNILFNLMVSESASGLSTILIPAIALYFLYLVGIEIFNIYVKIRRIQDFNIQTWKIILSIPFGFSALWVPGYLLNTTKPKKVAQEIKSKWYAKLVSWTTKTQLNTISMFVFITVLSSFFAGLNAVLLTFSFALLFGIWALQIGTKQFEKNMAKKYSSVAVIINIALIILFICTYIFAPKTQQNIQINISDIEVTSTQGQ